MTADDSLFSRVPLGQPMGDLQDATYERIPIDRIQPNLDQPRRSIDETSPAFQDLIGSIREQGLIQPISLWQKSADSDYLIEAGERRWRAYRHLADERPADFSRIPAMVRRLAGADPPTTLLIRGLLENLCRQDLPDGDKADAILRLREATSWTWETIATRLGIGLSTVQRLAAIGRHAAVRDAVNDRRITQDQAVAILRGAPDGHEVEQRLATTVSLPPPIRRPASQPMEETIDLMATPLAILRPRVTRLAKRRYEQLIDELASANH